MQFSVKVGSYQNNTTLNICDTELLGKKIEQDEVTMNISENYYGEKFVDTEEFYRVEVDAIDDSDTENKEIEALARSAVTQFEQYVKLNKKIPSEILGTVSQIDEPSRLADTIASHLVVKIPQK